MCFLASIWSFLILSSFFLLDANLGSRLIPDATDDQELGQGTHQATGNEEHEDVPYFQSIDGKISILHPFVQVLDRT